MNVYGSSTLNSQKLETTQWIFHSSGFISIWEMVKYTAVHPYYGILPSNTKEQKLIHLTTCMTPQRITPSEKATYQRLLTVWFHFCVILKMAQL